MVAVGPRGVLTAAAPFKRNSDVRREIVRVIVIPDLLPYVKPAPVQKTVHNLLKLKYYEKKEFQKKA